MLDRTTNTILTQWEPHYEDVFGCHPLLLRHRLHQSPLFDEMALAKLLETVERCDYHVNWMDEGVRREGEFGDLSGGEILEAVKRGNIWINLRAPHKANPAYGDLLEDIYSELETHNPQLATYKRSLTILISSPKVQVKYHCDVPGQTLWQVNGRKRVYVYPNNAPFLMQPDLERLVLGETHETDLGYRPWFDEFAKVYNLQPGEMLHWPHNGPHRVDNEDCLNVSVTTEHWTTSLRNAYAVNYANGLLRKCGFDPSSRPESGPGLYSRLALAGVVKLSGLQRKAAKPYRVDFTVDPASSQGVRYIKPHTVQH